MCIRVLDFLLHLRGQPHPIFSSSIRRRGRGRGVFLGLLLLSGISLLLQRLRPPIFLAGLCVASSLTISAQSTTLPPARSSLVSALRHPPFAWPCFLFSARLKVGDWTCTHLPGIPDLKLADSWHIPKTAYLGEEIKGESCCVGKPWASYLWKAMQNLCFHKPYQMAKHPRNCELHPQSPVLSDSIGRYSELINMANLLCNLLPGARFWCGASFAPAGWQPLASIWRSNQPLLAY